MSRVWKIGSRWNEYGSADASILSIFRRNNVVFAGLSDESRFLGNVNKGDYFAIADGYQIVAVAKAVSQPDYIGNLKHLVVTKNDNIVFDFESNKNWAVGVKVRIHEIDKKDWGIFYYQKRSSFCAINSAIANQVIDYYENDDQDFSIKSNTFTLFGNTDEGTYTLLNPHKIYVIPVYQRPYEWSESQIGPFVADIFNGYLGRDRSAKRPEPIFIGTMQLSQEHYISREERQQDVIDGQQRITTMTILLKELQNKYTQCKRLSSLSFDWIETHVNKEQSRLFDEYLTGSEESPNNRYYHNARYIMQSLFEEIQKAEEEDNGFIFDIEKFCDYLFKRIYFVVIETSAGLSKTIKIFNTINNTGLDLNGCDLFKIRMYEYLTDINGVDEAAFDEIQKIYQMVDSRSGLGISMWHVLDVYKNILITKYNLSSSLYSFGWETFFDRLFDTILGVKIWENFESCLKKKNFEISLSEISEVIDCISRKKKYVYSDSSVEFASRHISYWSRYSRAMNLFLYQFIYFNRNDECCYHMLERSIIALDKLFFYYSVLYFKQINEMNSFIANNLVKKIASSSPEEILAIIQAKINSTSRSELERNLYGYITDNAKRKNLICSLSEYIEARGEPSVIENIFETSFDIEHIHATADGSTNMDETLQNSIGNLAFLEQEINRSIQDQPFSFKRKRYPESRYKTIRRIAQMDKWDAEDAETRRHEEVRRMCQYVYEEDVL